MEHYGLWVRLPSPLAALQEYVIHWRGEHNPDVWPLELATLDNPGWVLKLARSEDSGLGESGTIIERWKGPFNWVGGGFDANSVVIFGGGTNLTEVLSCGGHLTGSSRARVGSNSIETSVGASHPEGRIDAEKWCRHDLEWLIRRLQSWYVAHCNGDWEHTYGVTLRGCPERGWSLTVELCETAWASLKLDDEIFRDSKVLSLFGNGVTVGIENQVFEARGSVTKLAAVIASFFTVVVCGPPSDWTALMAR